MVVVEDARCHVRGTGLAAGLAMTLLVSIGCASTPVAAEGALWVGVPPDGLRNGFAYGYDTGQPTPDAASQSARESCVSQASRFGLDPAICKLVTGFTKQCVAVAMDPVNRWAGWAIAPTLEEAQRQAVAKCGEGAQACRLDNSACDQ